MIEVIFYIIVHIVDFFIHFIKLFVYRIKSFVHYIESFIHHIKSFVHFIKLFIDFFLRVFEFFIHFFDLICNEFTLIEKYFSHLFVVYVEYSTQYREISIDIFERRFFLNNDVRKNSLINYFITTIKYVNLYFIYNIIK